MQKAEAFHNGHLLAPSQQPSHHGILPLAFHFELFHFNCQLFLLQRYHLSLLEGHRVGVLGLLGLSRHLSLLFLPPDNRKTIDHATDSV